MKKIIMLDSFIGAITLLAIYMVPKLIKDEGIRELYFLFFGIVFVFVLIDIILALNSKSSKQPQTMQTEKIAYDLVPQKYYQNVTYIEKTNEMAVHTHHAITELALLNEEDRVIKTWELTGRVSLLIGRENGIQDVDIDLEESAYSALVDYQHAVLNYAMENWFIEDLSSNNGVRIQKRQDGQCYKLAKDKPCKLLKGDIILIANTKLLVR